MTTKTNLKYEILNDLEFSMKMDKDVIIDALLKNDRETIKTFKNDYLKKDKMYQLLKKIDFDEFYVEIAE